MKTFAIIILLLLSAEFSRASERIAAPPPAPVPAPQPAALQRAVEVSFFGGLTGFDKGGYRAVRSSMAALLAEGVVDQFKTTYWGKEGGSSFCVELTHDLTVGIEQVTQVLEAVHPSQNSVYSYVVVEKCK